MHGPAGIVAVIRLRVVSFISGSRPDRNAPYDPCELHPNRVIGGVTAAASALSLGDAGEVFPTDFGPHPRAQPSYFGAGDSHVDSVGQVHFTKARIANDRDLL